MVLDLSSTDKWKKSLSLRKENEIDATIFLVICTNPFDVKSHSIETFSDEFFKLLGG